MIRIAIAEPPSPNYAAAVRLAGMESVVTRDAGEAIACDGLILPGGADVDPALYGQENTACGPIEPETDRLQMAILREFLSAGKPVLGICKGFQLLNAALGGTLIQHIPQVDRHGWDHGDKAHMTRCEAGCWLSEIYGETFPVNSAHHQALDVIGEGLRLIQRAEDGVPEGFTHEKLPVIGVQWHPERMCGALAREDTVDGLPVFLHFKSLIERKR